MPVAKLTPHEIAARGQAIYDRDIRSQVEGAHDGKFLVLDIETGEYEIDKNHVTAAKRSLAKRPDAVLYSVRIGRPATYRLGAFPRILPK